MLPRSGIKDAVVADPDKYTQREPELLRRTLADQRRAGKQLVLITNSDWTYSDTMMTFVCGGADWRDLFDAVICSARKPQFFTTEKLPCYELVLDGAGAPAPSREPLLRAAKVLEKGKVYAGGSARLVEKLFRVREDDVLYVGDHIFMDANAVKASMRWRTALVVQELENEIRAARLEKAHRATIDDLLRQKDELSNFLNALRCALQRYDDLGEPTPPHVLDARTADDARAHVSHLLAAMTSLDAIIAPYYNDEGATFNRHWGFLTRAGHNDKSHLHRQIEKYADVYCAKVTNLCAYTPYHYFRAAPQVLAHELNAHDVIEVRP